MECSFETRSIDCGAVAVTAVGGMFGLCQSSGQRLSLVKWGRQRENEGHAELLTVNQGQDEIAVNNRMAVALLESFQNFVESAVSVQVIAALRKH
ncbi:MAG: hypothetical protein ACI89J_000429 [Hyphomicrobiaceae bacterium]|jgi:hypothetical protein